MSGVRVSLWWKFLLAANILGAANYGRSPSTERWVMLSIGIVMLLIADPIVRPDPPPSTPRPDPLSSEPRKDPT